jgi:hypothetical protein
MPWSVTNRNLPSGSVAHAEGWTPVGISWTRDRAPVVGLIEKMWSWSEFWLVT